MTADGSNVGKGIRAREFFLRSADILAERSCRSAFLQSVFG